MTALTPIGKVEFFDDFVSDNVTPYTEAVGTGGSQDIADVHGGVWRMTCTNAETADVSLGGEVVFEADEGSPVIFETRVKSVTSAAAASSFCGLSDANTESGGVIIEDEDGTLNTVPTDAVGFLIETEQTNQWQAVGVQNDVDNSQVNLGADTANAVGTYQTLRMELHPNSSGTAAFYVNGDLKSTQTSFFRSSIVMAPVLSLGGRATAYSLDWDYVYVTAPRN